MSAPRHARRATQTAATSPGAITTYAALIVWAIASGFVVHVIGWVIYWTAVVVILDGFLVASWLIDLF